MNEPTWKHDEVFPIIARVIDARYRQQQRHVTAPEIADSLLADTEASAIIARAQLQQGSDQSLAWLANNMVAWFSQRITVGDSQWQPDFQRTKIDDDGLTCRAILNRSLSSPSPNPLRRRRPTTRFEPTYAEALSQSNGG